MIMTHDPRSSNHAPDIKSRKYFYSDCEGQKCYGEKNYIIYSYIKHNQNVILMHI